ncbi:hypothetical protein, partial [Klebsiella pneumoniae]|uniref:hypothetical protein n=1 Tax=Klebsiella pneumoniae TaxID=573 RepID=UPI001FB38519
MCNNINLSQEEKFIKLIDKYITQHRDHTINAVFYRKLYVLFVGYHLKYYYSSKQYCNSCFHVDNIMQMFTGVVSSLKANVLTKLNNSHTMLHCLNGLVDYISACKHPSFSSMHFLSVPVFQPSADTLPA